MMNNRGSVLIFVLIFIAFCSSAVIYIYEKTMKNMELTADDFYENQGNVYAMSAMTAVSQILEDDDNAYDSKNEDWAMIPLIPVPYGTVSISVTPVDSKIDLNAMLSPTQTIADRVFQACENVLEDQGINDITCGEIKDYIDSDQDASTGGAEARTYTVNGVEISTKNAPLDTISELRFIFPSLDEYQKIKPFFTAGDGTGLLNMNFASMDTIRLMFPELETFAEEIANYTDTEQFKDISNLQTAIGIPQDAYVAVLPFMTVKSSLFYAKVEVTLNDESRFYHGIINKNGSNTKVVRFLAGIDGQFY